VRDLSKMWAHKVAIVYNSVVDIWGCAWVSKCYTRNVQLLWSVLFFWAKKKSIPYCLKIIDKRKLNDLHWFLIILGRSFRDRPLTVEVVMLLLQNDFVGCMLQIWWHSTLFQLTKCMEQRPWESEVKLVVFCRT
jgi:hypothetical protein